jgi:hypothetical protein
MKYQQVKMELGGSRGGGGGGGGRGRKRAKDKPSESRKVGQKWNWRGLEMAISEKGHLSNFSKTNQ